VAAFSEEERAEIVRGFIAGETQVALAKANGCSPQTIGRVLRAEGVPAGAHGQLRDHHHAWKGGRSLRRDGYVDAYVEADDKIGQAMAKSNGRILEHRLVVGHELGRPLLAHEEVHHRNGQKDDNRIENLELRFGKHGKGVVLRCRVCGSADIEAV
jgi:transposase-like protein